MKNVLASYKNALWILAIGVCLLFLLVGFIVEAVKPYSGSVDRSQLDLNDLNIVDEGTAELPVGTGILNELSSTADAGQEYIDSLYFLCDGALSGLSDYEVVGTDQVWLGENGHIYVSDFATCSIVYPNDGSVIAPSSAASIVKPGILVICIGQDGLASSDESTFESGYITLVRSIQQMSPDTKIIVCSIPSVTTAYSGSDGLSSVMVTQANTWVKNVCMTCGVYYADIADQFETSGYLLSDYAASNGKTLNVTALEDVLVYLRNHALQ